MQSIAQLIEEVAMSRETSFIESHAFSDAFFGYRIGRVYDLIVEQADEYLFEYGLSIPSRTISTLLIIDESENVSIADVTNALQHPHQLVAQRVELLEELGLVTRGADPYDGRRKILQLTVKGEKEAALLKRSLRDAISALDVLFCELGADINVLMRAMLKSLQERSLNERVQDAKRNKKKIPA